MINYRFLPLPPELLFELLLDDEDEEREEERPELERTLLLLELEELRGRTLLPELEEELPELER